MANKAELLKYLDQHVFEPILHASPHGRSEHDQKDLQEVQEKTRAERDRFQHYESAERIVAMYKDDLSSAKAKPINERLKHLHLPILADVKDDFLKLFEK